ncbi:hypothetical protein H1P_10055 [Hyella patelloides LEGE 07179]|uniref:Uncharacterized protein n=1 Tax=Hyella patelloides LEGE 07179 TaxID=945734 RepID=A0A563VIM1_9CYAN|nr:hypothetical protein H1P_10055 [Hyella patelloides LEGE 07179]
MPTNFLQGKSLRKAKKLKTLTRLESKERRTITHINETQELKSLLINQQGFSNI